MSQSPLGDVDLDLASRSLTVRKLFEQEYWNRLWIVQEFVLARELYLLYGTAKFGYHDLERLLDFVMFSKCTQGSDQAVTAVSELMQIRKPNRLDQRYTFSDLIGLSCTKSCADPRDRIFGIQNLVHWPKLKITVDYSMPVLELWLSCVSSVVFHHTVEARNRNELAAERSHTSFVTGIAEKLFVSLQVEAYDVPSDIVHHLVSLWVDCSNAEHEESRRRESEQLQEFLVPALEQMALKHLFPLLWVNRWLLANSFQLLLEVKADINATDAKGRTVLMWAIIRQHEALVTLLLEAGADTNSQDVDGCTALMWAILGEHEPLSKALLNANVDVKVQDANGRTALMCAVQRKNSNLVEALLGACIELSSEDHAGKCAMVHAFEQGSFNTAKRLFRAHGRPDLFLRRVIEKQRWDVLDFLVKTCGELNIVNDTQDILQKCMMRHALQQELQIALKRLLTLQTWPDMSFQSASTGGVSPAALGRLLKGYLERGKELEGMSDLAGIIIKLAAEQKYLKSVTELLRELPRLATHSLQLAIDRGCWVATNFLIETCAALDISSTNMHVPLPSACGQGYGSIFRFLLETGTQADKRFRLSKISQVECRLALTWAVEHGQVDVVAVLLDFGKSGDLNTLLLSAAENGYVLIVKHLLGAGAQINNGARRPEVGDIGRWVSLVHAAANGYLDSLITLLGSGVHADLDTLLVTAAKHCQEMVVKHLLDAGAHADIEECHLQNERTALMHAAENGNLSTIKLLLDAGAQVDREVSGYTAFDYAARERHSAAFELLCTALPSEERGRAILRTFRHTRDASLKNSGKELISSTASASLGTARAVQGKRRFGIRWLGKGRGWPYEKGKLVLRNPM